MVNVRNFEKSGTDIETSETVEEKKIFSGKKEADNRIVITLDD